MSLPPQRITPRRLTPSRPLPIDRWLQHTWPPVLGALFVLGSWEFAVWWFRLPDFVLPTPQEILLTAWQDPQHILDDAATTIAEALGGYLIGSLLGFALAILFVTVPLLEGLAMPVYVTINSVPMIAYGPLAVIFLGVGSLSKVVLIVLAVSYTVLVNTLAGLRQCDPGMIALLRSFGAGKATILLKLRIPGAVPAIFAGMRVAVVHAMILAVVLEMLGAHAGLGWSVYRATQMMDFVEAWVAVGVAVIASLVIYAIVSWIGRRCVWW